MFHLRPDAGLVLFPALGVVTLAFALDRAQPGGLLRDQEARLHRLQLLEDLFARPLALAYCPRRHRTSAASIVALVALHSCHRHWRRCSVIPSCRQSDRKRIESGRSVSVRVDLGGHLLTKNKK